MLQSARKRREQATRTGVEARVEGGDSSGGDGGAGSGGGRTGEGATAVDVD